MAHGHPASTRQSRLPYTDHVPQGHAMGMHPLRERNLGEAQV
eukprot:COSAG06_NODE_30898_length_530_cov_1.069606_1_plen_41_part_10